VSSEAIFRGHDRAALDAQYDNRAKVADAAERLARFAEASARTRAHLECTLDVAFGAHPGETLDVFPAGAGAPVQLFVHGGYWRALDKRDHSFVARAFVPAGIATVVVNYALMPGVSMDELVRQVQASVAWTWRNAGSFGGDRERLFVSGHSAGGHLVARLMATDWRGFGADLPEHPIRGGTGISGLYDLEPIRLCFLNDELALDAATVRRHSPVGLARTCPGPLLLPVGGEEGPEYLRQTGALVDAWRGHGEPPCAMVMDGHDHFSIVAELERPDSELARAIHRQMGVDRAAAR